MDELDPIVRTDAGVVALGAPRSLRDWLLTRRQRRLHAIAELSEVEEVRRALQNCGHGLFLR